jgi:hypothetical protein
MSFFPTQAIAELASEFKLLRKDIQAMRQSLQRIELKLVGNVPEPTNKLPPSTPQPSTKPASKLFKN